MAFIESESCDTGGNVVDKAGRRLRYDGGGEGVVGIGWGDEDEMEREHNEGKGEVGDGERKARVNGPDAGWHRDRHLDCKRRFGHVDFMQNYCWARREEVRYSWRQFTSRKRT
jgi:hypothetical protein